MSSVRFPWLGFRLKKHIILSTEMKFKRVLVSRLSRFFAAVVVSVLSTFSFSQLLVMFTHSSISEESMRLHQSGQTPSRKKRDRSKNERKRVFSLVQLSCVASFGPVATKPLARLVRNRAVPGSIPASFKHF